MTVGNVKARVGRRELTSMFTLFVAAHAFLDYPDQVSEYGFEAAWMEPLLAGIMALVVFLAMDQLFRRFFPGKGLLEVLRIGFGRYVSTAIALALAGYFIFVTASIMRQFSETVIITVLPATPILVVSAMFVATVAYVATCGLEAVVRVAQIAFPIVIIAFIGLCLLTMNWWHPALLFPFWGSGIGSLAIGGYKTSAIFLNVLLLSIIYPHAQDYRDLRKVGVRSTLYSMLLLTAFLLVYHMVFAPLETQNLASPIYSLARVIHAGRFIQRIESIYIFIWVSAAVLKMSITIWAAAYILTDTFQWPSYRPIMPALALLCASISLTTSDVASVVRSQEDTMLDWGWIVALGVPLAILLIGTFRQQLKRGDARV
ncbi:GerAB/ArcD/ProY family transporter [Alicyclobacillus ferrooxydans]|uniref:Uncharacterized protein n=1 Tax=Alicyclobacillus ferrooxydans TaxID=471514 RepID=A0A0N8PPW6_9BACL|nr:endospore germination permease [Alicyclobacillus ferrooxydans]KPV45469.1 hypothetical protein AN477_00425 [Alicyclobacillus ferrooxydans]